MESINPFEQNIKRNLYFIFSFSIADSLKSTDSQPELHGSGIRFHVFFQDAVIRSHTTKLLHDKFLDIGKLFGDSLA